MSSKCFVHIKRPKCDGRFLHRLIWIGLESASSIHINGLSSTLLRDWTESMDCQGDGYHYWTEGIDWQGGSQQCWTEQWYPFPFTVYAIISILGATTNRTKSWEMVRPRKKATLDLITNQLRRSFQRVARDWAIRQISLWREQSSLQCMWKHVGCRRNIEQNISYLKTYWKKTFLNQNKSKGIHIHCMLYMQLL